MACVMSWSYVSVAQGLIDVLYSWPDGLQDIRRLVAACVRHLITPASIIGLVAVKGRTRLVRGGHKSTNEDGRA